MATRRRVVSGVKEGATGATTVGELADLLKAMRKERGEEVVVTAKSRPQPKRLVTGVFALDMALMGGLARGRQHMLSGPKSSGKTTALLRMVKNFQRNFDQETAVVIDPEHTIESSWAEQIGVDTERLLIVQPDTSEHCVDYVEGFLGAKEVGFIGLDSIAAMVPTKEAEQSADDSATPGLHAKLVTGMVRKSNRVLTIEAKRKHYPTIVYINQQRDKIGGWAPGGATPVSLPGGRALEFFVSTHIMFRNHEKLARDAATGTDSTSVNEHSFRIEKNKVNGGLRRGEYQMMSVDSTDYEGLTMGMVDDAGTMLATAKRMGHYTGGGRSWTLALPSGDVNVGNQAELINMLYSDADLYNELYWMLVAEYAVGRNMPDYHVQHILNDLRVWP